MFTLLYRQLKTDGKNETFCRLPFDATSSLISLIFFAPCPAFKLFCKYFKYYLSLTVLINDGTDSVNVIVNFPIVLSGNHMRRLETNDRLFILGASGRVGSVSTFIHIFFLPIFFSGILKFKQSRRTLPGL